MCTVTIVRAGGLLRVACNRDESRQRRQAHPPFITLAAGRHVLTPQDPQGRGTWIAANSAGLVFALLNTHDTTAAPPAEPRSRGLIIPMLVDCESLADIAWRIDEIPNDVFAPCRLLVAGEDHVMEVDLRARRRHLGFHAVDEPLLFTSSSLGDALVDGPRRLLFGQMTRTGTDLAAQQDAFHAHRWRDRPALSVHMSRPDACTVSTTVVEVSTREVRMIYQPAHCIEGTPVGLIIDRQPVAHDASPRTRRKYAAV